VSDPKLDRFRRLERPRAAGAEEPPRSTATDTRIEAVEGPAATAPAGAGEPASGGDLDRFRTPPERELELDLADHDSQPFQRCAACQTDNFRTAATCTGCGADLDTEPQRQFNRRFWAARRAEAAAEAQAGAARQARLEQDQAEEEARRHQAAEELARVVGDTERLRLEREGFGGGTSSPPWAWRWLGSMPLGWAVTVGLLLVGLPVLLYLLLPPLGLVAGALTLALFTPPGWRTRSRSRSWW
jgi:hypothetical protein